MNKKALITGITGQDGLYLARFLLKKGYNVIGVARTITPLVTKKLKYLNIENRIIFEHTNLVQYNEVKNLITKYKPHEVYNLAAQSSVGLSFSDPFETLSFNSQSVLILLEVIRDISPKTRFYQASSSEMYGNVSDLPITLQTVMKPVSPYGLSKKYSFDLVNLYRELFNLYTVNGVLFNHESILRNNNFFIKKIITDSISIKKGDLNYLEVGNLDVKRDFGYAPEYVSLMWNMLQLETPKNYIICSGKSVLLRDIVYYILDKLEISRSVLKESNKLKRPNEIYEICGDNSNAVKDFNWVNTTTIYDIIDTLIEEYQTFEIE